MTRKVAPETHTVQDLECVFTCYRTKDYPFKRSSSFLFQSQHPLPSGAQHFLFQTSQKTQGLDTQKKGRQGKGGKRKLSQRAGVGSIWEVKGKSVEESGVGEWSWVALHSLWAE